MVQLKFTAVATPVADAAGAACAMTGADSASMTATVTLGKTSSTWCSITELLQAQYRKSQLKLLAPIRYMVNDSHFIVRNIGWYKERPALGN